jgi:PAS domain S-box-containing protein
VRSAIPVIHLDHLGPQIWNSSPFSIMVTDYAAEPEQRKIIYVNSAFTNLTGFTAAEVVGKPVTLIEGPRTDPSRAAECEATLKNCKTYDATFSHYRKDGSEYLSRATVAPLIEPDGNAKFLMLIEVMVSSIGQSTINEESPLVGAFVSLSLPMPLREYPSNAMPTHLPSHPELDALKELWTTLRGRRRLPRRSDFDFGRVKRWVTQLSVATVMPDSRFQYRLFGTELTRLYGRDLTGCIIDDLPPKDLWSIVVTHYREVVRTRQPLFAPVSIANGRWHNEVSRLLLPLDDDKGDAVAFVMAADYPRFQ